MKRMNRGPRLAGVRFVNRGLVGRGASHGHLRIPQRNPRTLPEQRGSYQVSPPAVSGPIRTRGGAEQGAGASRTPSRAAPPRPRSSAGP